MRADEAADRQTDGEREFETVLPYSITWYHMDNHGMDTYYTVVNRRLCVLIVSFEGHQPSPLRGSLACAKRAAYPKCVLHRMRSLWNAFSMECVLYRMRSP